MTTDQDFTSKEFQRKIEDKWQKKWKEQEAFVPKVDKSKEKFFATVPYPYANSILHIGHGRSYTAADLFIRFQRLNGKNVLFPMGYHISGTPVLAVADNIARGDEKQIRLTSDALREYVSDENEIKKLIEEFKDPYKIADFFCGTIEDSFDSIGASVDWTRQFTTGDAKYAKFVEWQFKKLQEAGVLVQGKYPILYSVADGNAVGEDDIKDGDTDKVSLQEMTYILFKLEDSNDYIAVSTLRPDALFGTTNLWVDKDMDLVKISLEGKTVVIGKEVLAKFKHQFDNVEVIEEVKGSEYLNKKVVTPITGRVVLVAQADFIDPKHGTALVYSSPAGAPHDYMALVKAKEEGRLPSDVEVINTVETYDKKKNKIDYGDFSCPAESKCVKFGVSSDEDEEKLEQAKQELYKEEHYGGKLNNLCGEFEGVLIKFAKDKVKARLIELGLGGTLYETSRRAVTRAGDDVIVANLEGQWFLNYTEEHVKQKAYDLLDSMTYNPSKLRASQEGYLKWVAMRPCARKRGIGTKLPFDKDWVIESLSDSTIYQMLYLVFGIVRRENITDEQLKSEVFDYVFLGNGNIDLISEASNISVDILKEMREQVEYWKAFDFRYTAGAHMSNHLSFLIYHYGLIFPKDYHPKNITVGGMLIRDGAKISKSKGNGLPLVRIKNSYGVDLYRLYVAVASNYDIEMDFKDDEIMQLEKKFNRWKDLMFRSVGRTLKTYEEFSQSDKWLISKFYSRVNEYLDNFKDMRMREAYVSVLYEFLNDVAYHERRTSIESTLDVLRFIAKDYAKVMAPAIPHSCEELYEMLGMDSFVSLEAFDTDVNKFINKDIEDIEGISQDVLSKIARAKETKNLESISKVTVILASESRFAMFDKLKELLKTTKEFKVILPELMKEFGSDKKFITKFVPKTLGAGLSAYLPREDERKLVESLSEYVKEEYGAELEIKTSEEAEFNAGSLVPGQPSILVD